MELVPLETRELRDVFGSFPSGVVALCGVQDGVPVGMVAASFTSASIDPPLVSVLIQNTSTTWPQLKALTRIGVSVLGESHEAACIAMSAKVGDRFADVDWIAQDDAAVFVNGSSAWLECEIHEEFPAGDHVIVLLHILRMWHDEHGVPLVFHRSKFRQLAPPGR